MRFDLEHRDRRATLTTGSGVVRVSDERGRVASCEAPEPLRLVDRTPLSVRVRDASGRVFGVRLTERGPELAGDGFGGVTLSAPTPA